MEESPRVPELINKLLNSGQLTVNQRARLRIVRAYFFEGLGRSATARACGACLPVVDRWRKRWVAGAAARLRFFDGAAPGGKAERDFLLAQLADAPRSGAPARFTPAQRERIRAVALSDPRELGVPIERWSYQLLADYLIEQGIVDHICTTTIGDFLK